MKKFSMSIVVVAMVALVAAGVSTAEGSTVTVNFWGDYLDNVVDGSIFQAGDVAHGQVTYNPNASFDETTEYPYNMGWTCTRVSDDAIISLDIAVKRGEEIVYSTSLAQWDSQSTKFYSQDWFGGDAETVDFFLGYDDYVSLEFRNDSQFGTMTYTSGSDPYYLTDPNWSEMLASGLNRVQLRPDGSGGPIYQFEVIPEPATLGMLAIGGLAMLRRRKRK